MARVITFTPASQRRRWVGIAVTVLADEGRGTSEASTEDLAVRLAPESNTSRSSHRSHTRPSRCCPLRRLRFPSQPFQCSHDLTTRNHPERMITPLAALYWQRVIYIKQLNEFDVAKKIIYISYYELTDLLLSSPKGNKYENLYILAFYLFELNRTHQDFSIFHSWIQNTC